MTARRPDSQDTRARRITVRLGEPDPQVYAAARDAEKARWQCPRGHAGAARIYSTDQPVHYVRCKVCGELGKIVVNT